MTEGDEITIAGVFDDHLRTKLSQFIVQAPVSDGATSYSLRNKDPKMKNRLPYYDDASNTVPCPPHPFPNGYPDDWDPVFSKPRYQK